MKAADLALYEAKNAGRNRVVLCDAAPIVASPGLGGPDRPDAAHAPAARERLADQDYAPLEDRHSASRSE